MEVDVEGSQSGLTGVSGLAGAQMRDRGIHHFLGKLNNGRLKFVNPSIITGCIECKSKGCSLEQPFVPCCLLVP
jgi:hypothetical protein